MVRAMCKTEHNMDAIYVLFYALFLVLLKA